MPSIKGILLLVSLKGALGLRRVSRAFNTNRLWRACLYKAFFTIIRAWMVCQNFNIFKSYGITWILTSNFEINFVWAYFKLCNKSYFRNEILLIIATLLATRDLNWFLINFLIINIDVNYIINTSINKVKINANFKIMETLWKLNFLAYNLCTC